MSNSTGPARGIGVVRQVDELNRICVPIPARRLLGIHPGGPVEFFVDTDAGLMALKQHGCTICGQLPVIKVSGRDVCPQCCSDAARHLARKGGRASA